MEIVIMGQTCSDVTVCGNNWDCGCDDYCNSDD